MNVSDAIRLKRSTLRRAHVRKYTDQPLPEETILARLYSAASSTPDGEPNPPIIPSLAFHRNYG